MVVMFIAHSFAVSAWAQPCFNMVKIDQEQTTDTAKMLCHDRDEQKSPIQHCDGICLCFHASLHQTPLLSGSKSCAAPMFATLRLAHENEHLVSIAMMPPRRPPKT